MQMGEMTIECGSWVEHVLWLICTSKHLHTIMTFPKGGLYAANPRSAMDALWISAAITNAKLFESEFAGFKNQ
jgi:hypothetical protein